MTDASSIKMETVKCPLCQLGEIAVTTRPEYYSYKTARAIHQIKRIPVHHPEQVKIESSCPNCKASKSDIKDALDSGSGKKVSHEDLLKRLKESGLPLILESKKKN